MGAELKENVKRAWKKKFIQEDANNVGLDTAILMNPKTWEASGHIKTFSDPLIDCRSCKSRHRADKLLEDSGVISEAGGLSHEELMKLIKENNVVCPKCGKLDYTDIREFNLMFKTFQGVTEDAKSEIYLRPETAQGIFVNFKNVLRTSRKKVPFGIAQIGKAFRNEITPGNFIFRVREFEQMELEFFCKPGEDLEWFGYWKNFCLDFLKTLGLNKENLRYRDHAKEELSFYSKATTDIEYKFPMGWGELWGVADRTDYDLTQHMEHSKNDIRYLDPDTNLKYIPYVIEPSVGLDRLIYAIISDAYKKEILDNGEERQVLKIHPALAPIKVTILPLIKKMHNDKAMDIYGDLCKDFMCSIDTSGSIGKRYRRSDAIGTPLCVTVDDETINNGTVTVRLRDTMEQITLPVSELKNYIEEEIKF